MFTPCRFFPTVRLFARASFCILLLLLAAQLQSTELTYTSDEGETIKVLFFLPELEKPSGSPLVLMVAGSTGNDFMVRAQYWLGGELLDRGWAIAVPIPPDGHPFNKDSADLLNDIADSLHAEHPLKPGKSLLVGMSTGGSKALDIATAKPDYFLGVMAVPGQFSTQDSLPPLNSLPVFLRIGEKDSYMWHKSLDKIQHTLESAGADVNAGLVSGGRHVFHLDWVEVENWLENILNRN